MNVKHHVTSTSTITTFDNTAALPLTSPPPPSRSINVQHYRSHDHLYASNGGQRTLSTRAPTTIALFGP
jgi:hypothetical protein